MRPLYTLGYQSTSHLCPPLAIPCKSSRIARTLNMLAWVVLQLVHDQYTTNENIKLSEWIAISGAVCALFTFVIPHLHHLRIYSGISVVLIFIFSIIAIAISAHDGLCIPPFCDMPWSGAFCWAVCVIRP